MNRDFSQRKTESFELPVVSLGVGASVTSRGYNLTGCLKFIHPNMRRDHCCLQSDPLPSQTQISSLVLIYHHVQ